MFIGKFYIEDKGSKDWLDFLGWCIGARFSHKLMWTQDYKVFLEEGDFSIGAPIYNGGSWYPSTQVVVTWELDKFQGVTPNNLLEFINYFADINSCIVLNQAASVDSIALKISVIGTMEITF